MSFSYKTLNSNDIALTSYIANKQWEITNATLSQNGIKIYIGENLPINKANPFNPNTDSQTENEEYRRLVFDSIKNLYYQNYVSGTLSGDFYQSSSFFNYEQSTLVSGTIRNLPSITGSVNGLNVYDISSSLYDSTTIFDPDRGSKIVVISIDQNIFGSGLSPNTVNISGSTYNLQDDGEGNVMDTLTSTYVGNVFYSQGLIIITNQDYLCVFGAPPTTTNDFFSYINVNYTSQTLDILANDIADCGIIDPTSVQLMSVPGISFPNYTLNNGIITITPDQSSIIPGNYQLNYTVGDINGIRSNTSSINLAITSRPLNLRIPTNQVKSCFDAPSSNLVTFTINNGVPPYSYSLDNGVNYTGVPGFFDQTINTIMTSAIGNKIYIKDYLGTIVTGSFDSLYPPITYTISSKMPCSGSSNGTLSVSKGSTDTAISASIDGGATYFVLPKTFTGIASGSSTLYIKDTNGCVTSSIIDFNYYTALTASVTQSNVSCYGSSNGSISVAFTGVTDTLIVNMTDATGSYIYSNINLNSFPNNTVTASNLVSGSYNLIISASGIDQCQSYNNTFVLTSPTSLTFKTTSSYTNSSSNAIIFSGSGGTSPYTYYAIETGSGAVYSSTSSSVALNGIIGGTFNTFIVDTNGCSSTSSLVTSYGRAYQYTGSFCSQSLGNNTGYVSSSGIQQNFTSGPYSGSIVTSSYSSGSTLLGPTVNFKQLFISGTFDYIQPLGENTPWYQRYYYNATLCPPGGCYAPILVTAFPISCSTNWSSSYSVTYNSGSSLATKTIIEYSYTSNFTNKVTQSINNASPTISPFYTLTNFGVFNTPDTVMYFRAYNSCSIGTTSSYSNVLTASCIIPTPPITFTLRIKNKTGNRFNYSTGSINYSLNNDATVDLNFTGQTLSTKIYTIINPHSTLEDSYTYSYNISSSNDVNGNVYTTVSNPTDFSNPQNNPTQTVIYEYINGGFDYAFLEDQTNSTPDLILDIDKNTYNNSGIITLQINPGILF